MQQRVQSLVGELKMLISLQLFRFNESITWRIQLCQF